MCSAEFGCFLWLLVVLLSRCVVQIFSELLSDGFSCTVTAGITVVFIFRIRCLSVLWTLYFKIISAF